MERSPATHPALYERAFSPANALEASIHPDVIQDRWIREVLDPVSLEFVYDRDPIPVVRGGEALFDFRRRLDVLRWALLTGRVVATDREKALQLVQDEQKRVDRRLVELYAVWNRPRARQRSGATTSPSAVIEVATTQTHPKDTGVTKSCAVCGTRIGQPATGRPRSTCSDRCRQKQRRQKVAA